MDTPLKAIAHTWYCNVSFSVRTEFVFPSEGVYNSWNSPSILRNTDLHMDHSLDRVNSVPVYFPSFVWI